MRIFMIAIGDFADGNSEMVISLLKEKVRKITMLRFSEGRNSSGSNQLMDHWRNDG